METSNPKVTFRQKGSHLPLTTHSSSFQLSACCIYHFPPCVRVICAGSALSAYMVSSLSAETLSYSSLDFPQRLAQRKSKISSLLRGKKRTRTKKHCYN